MTTVFDWLMFVLFGKRWVLHKMRNDYKTGILIKEMDLEYQMSRSNDKQKTKLKIEKELQELEATPLPVAEDHLSAEELEKPKAKYDFDKKHREEREERVKVLKNRIKVAEQEVAMADGEVQRLNAENFKMRTKWDFVRGYRIKSTYTDYAGK